MTIVLIIGYLVIGVGIAVHTYWGELTIRKSDFAYIPSIILLWPIACMILLIDMVAHKLGHDILIDRRKDGE